MITHVKDKNRPPDGGCSRCDECDLEDKHSGPCDCDCYYESDDDIRWADEGGSPWIYRH